MSKVKAKFESSAEELEHAGEWDHGVEPDVLHAGQEKRHEPKDAVDRMASESIRQKVEKVVKKLDETVNPDGSHSHVQDPPTASYVTDRTP